MDQLPALNVHCSLFLVATHNEITDKLQNEQRPGSYQLSHIYDILFAPKLSDKRRLDTQFRRRLQLKPKRQH